METGEVRGIEVDPQMSEALVVAPPEDLAVVVKPGDRRTISERHREAHGPAALGQPALDRSQQVGLALSGQRRSEHLALSARRPGAQELTRVGVQ